jgi:hypothetical protein
MRVSALIAPPRPEAIDKLRRIVGRPPKIRSRVKIEMVRRECMTQATCAR